MALLMGLRASEVMGRTARDVDDGGCLLWIDSGKTDHSRRHLRVPAVLAPHLAKLAADRQGAPYLFGEAKGGRPPTHRLAYIVQRLCRRYEVPKVCPHSLRGLYATLAMEQGAVADMVAASLGHTSFTMTARHYAKPQAVRNAKTERVLAVLDRPGTQNHEGVMEQEPPVPEAPTEVACAELINDASPSIAEIIPSLVSPLPVGTGSSLEDLLASMNRTPLPTESPLIAWLSGFTRHKPARVLGPYKNRDGYRLIVFDGPQRKSLVAPTLEQAKALQAELTAVINRSRILPRPGNN
jgi:hypothetical protein